MKRVLIAAGGTGGHLFPAQQLGRLLREDFQIHFAGHGIGSSPFFQKKGVLYTDIVSHPLSWNCLGPLYKGFRQACALIQSFQPDVVVGFGSYHAFPVLAASAWMRQKIILFEANCLSGKVNRLFRPAAACFAFQFPGYAGKNGVPVRLLPWEEEKSGANIEDARRFFGLDPKFSTVLVFGGSQGASFLNQKAPDAISKLKNPVQVIHLAGAREVEQVKKAYEGLSVRACVKSFEPDMSLAYAAADVALCRSGAGTIAELIRSALPAVLIPYPFAVEDHQKENGLYFANKLGGGKVLIQREASRERLTEAMDELCQRKQEIEVRLKGAYQETKKRSDLAEIVRRIA